MKIPLRKIAYSRSGDKGSNVNIGLISYTEKAYPLLIEQITVQALQAFFSGLQPKAIHIYPLPNLWAINIVLEGVLNRGGLSTLRIDSQGKALGQALLEMTITIDKKLWEESKVDGEL
jgi:hypothetical protein